MAYEKLRYLTLDDSEFSVVATALNNLRTSRINDKEPVAYLDKVFLKVMNAPLKPVKVIHDETR
ncbi:MAG: hypothetical protein RSD35_09075 [Oscillospiraceae bacterium]